MRVCVCVCVCLCVCSLTTVARWLTAASQQEGHGFDSHMGRCWLWGAGPPQSAQFPRPFCVEFACSPRAHKGFLPLRTPTEKHAKRTELSCPSLTETDGSIGRRALRSCPLLLEDPGGGTIRDGLKAEVKFTATSGLRVCVCVLCRLHIYITRVCCCELFVQSALFVCLLDRN